MMTTSILRTIAAVTLACAVPACATNDAPESIARPAPLNGAIGRSTGVLVGGASSPRALVESALAAFRSRDTVALARLLVTRDEFMSVVYPELGAHYAAARDTRTETMRFLWQNQALNAQKGMRKALREIGGKELKVMSIEFTGGVKEFPSYRLYEGTEVTVGVRPGSTATLYALGSMIEQSGRFKLMSYRDLD
jgi:hypothetical protein